MQRIFSVSPRACAIVAMLCPVLVLALVFISAPRMPDFNLARSLFSSLSLGEYGWVGALFFIFAAVTMLAFARALSCGLSWNKNLRTAQLLLCAAALCLLLLIFVDIDHLQGVWTLKRIVHWVIAGAAAASFVISAVLIANGLKNNPAWRNIYAFNLILAVLTLTIGVIMALTVRAGLTALLERLVLSSGVIWVEVMSARMYQLSLRDSE